ncbi:MAG: hypothetical protein R3344_15290, partial [Acidobacteriota bacterium]|nr:hypothetical protein [Acidobacteriota bacterium]
CCHPGRGALTIAEAEVARLRSALEEAREHGDNLDFLLKQSKERESRAALNTEVLQADVRDLLRALGISDHARPISPHEVVQTEVLPAIRAALDRVRALKAERERLVARIIEAQGGLSEGAATGAESEE